MRQQQLEQALVLEEAKTGIRILYASEGWNDQAVTVSGDVLIPAGNAPEGGWPVLAWEKSLPAGPWSAQSVTAEPLVATPATASR